MEGNELTKLMQKGTVYVEFHGETYEVVQKFKHVSWIKRNGIKKSVPHRYFTFKTLIESKDVDLSKMKKGKINTEYLKEKWFNR